VQDAAIEEASPMQIESLRKLTTKELKVRFREVCGAASLSSSHTHLLRRVAWHLQANASGGLKESALKRASQLTMTADPEFPLSEAVRKELEGTGEPRHNRDSRLPPVDTTIERSYRGKQLSIVVLENGFEYHGKIYASLSSIAHQITGTRWNGFHFFGLKEPWRP
jgi:poly-gamma-glutamate capsule biosynthesis protein CapA/YwtB (metallophosphatase superfamily)